VEPGGHSAVKAGSGKCHIVTSVKSPWRAMLSLVVVVIMLPKSQVTTALVPEADLNEAAAAVDARACS